MKGFAAALFLLLVAGLLLPYVYDPYPDCSFPKPFADIRALEAAVEFYRLHNGKLPLALDALVTSGYLHRAVLDLCGRPYEYSLLAPARDLPDREVYIWSLGCDRKWGGTDQEMDWVSWDL